MEKHNSSYVKHTQKDYSMSLKLQIVQEIERGELSTRAACRKYGIQARSTIMSWLQKFGNFDGENQLLQTCPKHQNKRF